MNATQNARADYLLSLEYLTDAENAELDSLLELSRLAHEQRDQDEIAQAEAA
jgi:hypothetical protein